MPIGSDGAVLRQLRTLFDAGTVVGLTDGQLLERFATRTHEAAEAAFAALVKRHGPMVLRVCRGVLDDPHDAQDAFQATFLVLVKKARGLWVQDSLGPWLHQVAYRTACRARSDVARRRRHERHAAERIAAERIAASGEEDGVNPVKEWERVLHEEINRLPQRYRTVVVVCDLEGRTHEQAARLLGCPVGTVKSRLARGRERLRARLIRRGVVRSAGVPAVIFGLEAARAGVPAALAGATVRAATRFAAGKMAAGVVPASVVALAEGVLKTMTMTKMITLAVAASLLGAVLAGVGALAQPAGGPPPDRDATQPPLMKYELRLWRDGEPIGEPIVAEATRGVSIQIETADGPLEIRPAPERPLSITKRRIASAGARPARRDSALRLKPAAADLTTSVEPTEVKPGDAITYRVHAKLQPGWGIFPEGPLYSTRFDFFDTAGLRVASDWSASKPVTRKSHPGFPDLAEVEYYEGEVTWSVRLEVPKEAEAGMKVLRCQAGYQILNEKALTVPGRWTLPQVSVTVVP